MIGKIGAWIIGICFFAIFGIIMVSFYNVIFMTPDVVLKIFFGFCGTVFLGLTLLVLDLLIALSNT